MSPSGTQRPVSRHFANDSVGIGGPVYGHASPPPPPPSVLAPPSPAGVVPPPPPFGVGCTSLSPASGTAPPRVQATTPITRMDPAAIKLRRMSISFSSSWSALLRGALRDPATDRVAFGLRQLLAALRHRLPAAPADTFGVERALIAIELAHEEALF